jgi:CheY-like chemotaxis protein
MMAQRVLLVDDNNKDQRAIGDLFERRNEGLAIASDSISGFRKGIELAVDLALIDLTLPDPNGVKLARMFRQHPRTRDTVIVAISSLDQTAIELATDGVGVAAAISKCGGYINIVDRALNIVERLRQDNERANQLVETALRNLHFGSTSHSTHFRTMIIYSRDDFRRAQGVYAKLERGGIPVAMDVESFVAGEEWLLKARQLIECSSTVTLLASRASANSPQVRQELECAIALNKPILPVGLDDVDRRAFGDLIASLQWLDLRGR